MVTNGSLKTGSFEVIYCFEPKSISQALSIEQSQRRGRRNSLTSRDGSQGGTHAGESMALQCDGEGDQMKLGIPSKKELVRRKSLLK